MRSQNQTVTLRWAMWLPFEGGSPEERETTLELAGGCQGFPSDRLVFTKTLPQASGKKVWMCLLILPTCTVVQVSRIGQHPITLSDHEYDLL